jgi:subtilisin family serine protease
MKCVRFGFVVWAMSLLIAGPEWAQGKPRIDKAADLPRFTYAVSGKLESLVRDEAAFAPFAVKLRADVESVLGDYEIADKSTQRQLQNTLLQLDVLEGKHAAALARVETLRALQDKPADKLLTGLLARAVVETRQQAPAATPQAYSADVAERLSAALKPLPFAVVSNGIKQAKASAELVGESLVLGNVRSVLQPIVDQAGALSSDLAPGIVSARYALTVPLPLKQTLIDTYGRYLQANQVEKPDIWAVRNVTLPAGKKGTPVIVAVWDSGVDSSLFKQQLLRGGRGQPVFLAFDKYSVPARTELLPIPPALQSQLPLMKARSKGFSDLQANIDSPQAAEIKQLLSNLKPDEYKATIEAIVLTGQYEHGTHVAGIALDGNPFARVMSVRMEFGHTLQPDPCPSRAQAEKDAKALSAEIEFIKRHKARVVNMSWGGSVSAIQGDLEKCGTGKTPDDRKKLAREYFDLFHSVLVKGFASAPQTLWIAAAGNSNEDASFAEDAPANIVLPNLLTVGAVDRAGDEASFTSYGPTVKVHANGYQVESFIPGGERVALSGTSMAAPQVTNLAAKMLAVNPRLTPAQLIEIIIGTSEKTVDGRRTLVHPARAVEAARSRKHS